MSDSQLGWVIEADFALHDGLGQDHTRIQSKWEPSRDSDARWLERVALMLEGEEDAANV